MKPNRVRTIAICVFKKGGRIFVAEGYDPAKQETFYRPLGGRIEFGERGQRLRLFAAKNQNLGRLRLD